MTCNRLIIILCAMLFITQLLYIHLVRSSCKVVDDVIAQHEIVVKQYQEQIMVLEQQLIHNDIRK